MLPGVEEPLEGGVALVIDDEPGVREVMAQLLERAGFVVLTAPDGRGGVDVFLSHGSVDVVVVDMTMPGMPGDETFRALRAIDPEIAVVIVSGYDESDACRRLRDEPRPPSFVQKPFSSASLLAAVQSARGAGSSEA